MISLSEAAFPIVVVSDGDIASAYIGSKRGTPPRPLAKQFIVAGGHDGALSMLAKNMEIWLKMGDRAATLYRKAS